jgi:uncharacterized protein (TIGR00255 family)
MIKSMTGFGRSEIIDNNKKICIEIKSVNHRYLDINLKMPKKLNIFDSAIRTFIKKNIARGKVDVFISYEDLSENAASLKFNQELAKEYLSYFKKMEYLFKINNDATVMSLSRCPEVLVMEEQNVDEDELWKLIEEALCGAINKFIETRVIEGEHLKEDISKKLDELLKNVLIIEENAPKIIEEYKLKLMDKMSEFLENAQIDESRIAAEVVLFADKICVDEEIVRLKSHINKMKNDLSMKDDIGRKLDFLAQEMNREANTILSKSTDVDITNIGIELKTEIEKIREQIQNIE